MTGLLIIAVLVSGIADVPMDSTGLLAGQDLQLKAPVMWACRQTQRPDEHVLLFENGFSMTIGDNYLSSQNAVLWLRAYGRDVPGMSNQSYYQVQVYLENDVVVRQGKFRIGFWGIRGDDFERLGDSRDS